MDQRRGLYGETRPGLGCPSPGCLHRRCPGETTAERNPGTPPKERGPGARRQPQSTRHWRERGGLFLASTTQGHQNGDILGVTLNFLKRGPECWNLRAGKPHVR